MECRWFVVVSAVAIKGRANRLVTPQFPSSRTGLESAIWSLNRPSVESCNQLVVAFEELTTAPHTPDRYFPTRSADVIGLLGGRCSDTFRQTRQVRDNLIVTRSIQVRGGMFTIHDGCSVIQYGRGRPRRMLIDDVIDGNLKTILRGIRRGSIGEHCVRTPKQQSYDAANS